MGSEEGGVSDRLFAAGTTWSPEELDKMRQEWDARMPLLDMCLAHGRTASAVVSKLVMMGLYLQRDGWYHRIEPDPEFGFAAMRAVDEAMRRRESLK